MDKFFIRKVSAVWAFNKLNEAVWKCSDVTHLRISQDGETTRKRDSSGATMFRLNTSKSATVSFDVALWDMNILSAMSGGEIRKLDGGENPYDIEPICIPYAQSYTLTADDIELGYVELSETPRKNDWGYYEISAHKLSKEDTIERAYQQSLEADDDHFSVDDIERLFFIPTSLRAGDVLEVLYEFNAYKGTEIVNTVNSIPETWKVRFLLLVSPVCSTDKIMSVWITANNASPDISNELNFEVDENISIRLELGCSACDDKKKLYEIVIADNQSDGSDGVILRTHDGEAVYTYDNEPIQTIR